MKGGGVGREGKKVIYRWLNKLHYGCYSASVYTCTSQDVSTKFLGAVNTSQTMSTKSTKKKKKEWWFESFLNHKPSVWNKNCTEKPDNKQLQFVYCRVDRRSEGFLQDIHARFLDPEFIYHFLSSTLRGHWQSLTLYSPGSSNPTHDSMFDFL